MNMKRMTCLLTLILAVFVLPSSQFVWAIAEAEEPLVIVDGIYQVELSFLSPEDVEHEVLFNRDATLTVNEGQYTLSVPLKHENQITSITAKQQGEKIISLLNRKENLVQFDMKDLEQMIELDGTVKLPSDETPISFSAKIGIDTNSLPQVEQPEASKPTPPTVEDKQEHHLIDYTLLTDGKKEPSIMNTYVNSIMKIIKKDDTFYAQMEILKSSWITGLTVEQQGEMIEPAQLSLVDDIRVIQFEVKDFHEKIRLWVEVDIPELTYHHDYYVQLLFDEHQVAKFLGETMEPVLINPSETTETIVKNPSQQSQIVKPKIDVKPQMDVKPKTDINQTVMKPILVPMEEKLAFDRTLDEVLEEENPSDQLATDIKATEKQGTSNSSLQVEPMNMLKISMLVLVCILSGIMLIRRLKNGKKEGVNE